MDQSEIYLIEQQLLGLESTDAPHSIEVKLSSEPMKIGGGTFATMSGTASPSTLAASSTSSSTAPIPFSSLAGM